jgi:hypothetical protein
VSVKTVVFKAAKWYLFSSLFLLMYINIILSSCMYIQICTDARGLTTCQLEIYSFWLILSLYIEALMIIPLHLRSNHDTTLMLLRIC